jgi:DNA-binding response OmpR family regulator
LGDALAAAGCAMEGVTAAGAFLLEARSGRYALGVLHDAWPSKAEASGTLRELRRASSMPCALVAATPLPAGDRVAALEAGADEILDPATPFPEAVARVRSMLRRSGGPADAVPCRARGGWSLLAGVRLVRGPDGDSHRLTAAEFDLLRLLAAAPGRAVGRDAISLEAFRRPWRPDDRAVDGLVKRLRRKLGPDSILTSRGLGYALTIDVNSE